MRVDDPVTMFRRGVAVTLSLLIGAEVTVWGLWLLIPFRTFQISPLYQVMNSIASETVWGRSFTLTGGSLFVVGLAMWLKVRTVRPVPVWLRVTTSLLLLCKLLFVVSIFYLAAKESTATPVFLVMSAGLFVLLLSALDELELIERVSHRAQRWKR